MSDTLPAPTVDEWRALYRAADAFKQLAPWQWMYDSDLFGVQNPETGEFGYCCIMGNLGEMFGLALYLGDEGLNSYTDLQMLAAEEPTVFELVSTQLCLMASFEDREVLEKRDRDQIKALGLKYRGRGAWPLFRNYLPGYYPWHLSGADARFLTLALEQICDVTPRFRDNDALFAPPPELCRTVPMPIYEQGTDGMEEHIVEIETHPLFVRVYENGIWQDAWHMPSNPFAAPLQPPIDEVHVQRIRQLQLQRGGTWESDCFFTPQPIQERSGERPYFPKVSLLVDSGSGMVLAPELMHPASWHQSYQKHVLATIEQTGVLPTTILVAEDELEALLMPLAELLGFSVEFADELPALDPARDSFLKYINAM